MRSTPSDTPAAGSVKSLDAFGQSLSPSRGEAPLWFRAAGARWLECARRALLGYACRVPASDARCVTNLAAVLTRWISPGVLSSVGLVIAGAAVLCVGPGGPRGGLA